jgi:hypothetical protein
VGVREAERAEREKIENMELSKVLTAVTMKMAVFWVVAPCRLV